MKNYTWMKEKYWNMKDGTADVYLFRKWLKIFLLVYFNDVSDYKNL